MAMVFWKRLREAATASAAPQLLRSQTDDPRDVDDDGDTDIRDQGPGDNDADDMTCPTCGGVGIKGGDLCPTCDGSGSVMKESTRGPYWVYSDDPEWQEIREASHPEWAELKEAPRTFSSDVRKKYASSGVAMKDGSYPIPDKDALGRAVKAIGRASDPDATKAHIKKRAAALGATDTLPDDWQDAKEAGKDNFGGKQAKPFGKDGEPQEDEEEDGDPKPSKTKESISDRLAALEEQLSKGNALLKSLREARPAIMTPAFSNPTRVKASDGREGYLVALIREGAGNSEDDQWYTEEALREMVESGVCEGMQAFGDHPTEDEEQQRPERSVKHLVGTYHDVKFVKEGEGQARVDAVFVPLTLDENHPQLGWVVTLAEAATRSPSQKPICGVSLLGLSGGEDMNRPDGTFGRMVSMVRPSSGDIVTNAGAGGGFIRQLMESARARRNRSNKELEPMKSLAFQNAVREAAKRVREATTDDERNEALGVLEALEGETIDSAPDTVTALREAAPGLVSEIEETIKSEDGKTVEELTSQLREAQSTISRFTDAVGVTEALREAGVEDPIELRKYAQDARRLGYTDAEAIKLMVETDRSFQEKQRQDNIQAMREAFSLDEPQVEGVVGRVPVSSLPSDGGVEILREAGLPIVDAE